MEYLLAKPTLIFIIIHIIILISIEYPILVITREEALHTIIIIITLVLQVNGLNPQLHQLLPEKQPQIVLILFVEHFRSMTSR